MRQFILDRCPAPGDRIDCGERDSRYLLKVLRLKPGAEFDGSDPEGRVVRLRLLPGDGASARLEALEAVAAAGDRPEITLFQCLPKGKKMDQIVRQVTEAGVARIVPLVGEHSVSRPEEDRGEDKKGRWERVIREARQQSGSAVRTEILPPLRFDRARELFASVGLGLFFHEAPLEQGSLHRYLSSYPESIGIVVGPEGGLSPKEVAQLRDAGFLPVHLGRNVLRTETAAIFAVSAVMTLLLEKESWRLQE